MIKISDYKLIQFKDSKKSSQNKNNNKKFYHFKYLYPNINQQSSEWNYENQLKQKFQVSFIQTYQECEQIQELKQFNIFPPSQQIYLLKNTNPNSQKLYISINTIPKNLNLQKVIEYYFTQKLFIPSQIFCTFFIERILKFYDIFEQIGFILKTITPKKLYMSEDNIYLNYSKVVQLLTNTNSLKIQENQEQFTGPELLKVIKREKQGQIMKKINNNFHDEISKKQSEQQLDNKIYYDVNIGQKLYNKAILYSCALCILSCFKFKLSLQDRYKALRNSKQLNNYLKGWRKQIKIYHQGKYISKLLKLMLQPSESLRDSIQTFRMKMNSAQFNFLKSKINKKEIISHNTMKTQSQIQQNNLNNTNRKTIDIHISANSNASSINRSWLSSSHVNNTYNNDKITSPNDYFRGSTQQRNFHSVQKSKISLTKSQINEIKQQGKINCDSQKSVVDIQIDWDDDSFSKYSQKSKQSKKQSKSSSDDNKNKIKVSINTIQQQSLSQQINDKIQYFKRFQIIDTKIYSNKQLYQTQKLRINPSNDNKDKKITLISSSQTSKYKNIKYYNFQKSETQKDQYQSKQSKQNNKQIVNNEQQIKQTNKYQQQMQQQQQRTQQNPNPSNIFDNKNQKQLKKKQPNKIQINESSQYNTESFMSLNKKQSEQLVLQQLSAMDSVYRKNQLICQNNLSVVIGQGLLNNNQYSIQIQNKSIYKQQKQNKQIHKYLLKKDKYNSRSRIIILTLFVIYVVYLFIDWFINKNVNKSIKND